MHYSKENIREANRLCIDICVIKKGGKRVGNYSRGESLLEGLSRYLKYMVSQAIRIWENNTPGQGHSGRIQGKSMLGIFGKQWNETCH